MDPSNRPFEPSSKCQYDSLQPSFYQCEETYNQSTVYFSNISESSLFILPFDPQSTFLLLPNPTHHKPHTWVSAWERQGKLYKNEYFDQEPSAPQLGYSWDSPSRQAYSQLSKKSMVTQTKL